MGELEGFTVLGVWVTQAFDEQPHLHLLKEMFVQAFATPKRHPRSKPFLDHVLAFSVADGRIWIRNYQARPAGSFQELVGVTQTCCVDPSVEDLPGIVMLSCVAACKPSTVLLLGSRWLNSDPNAPFTGHAGFHVLVSTSWLSLDSEYAPFAEPMLVRMAQIVMAPGKKKAVQADDVSTSLVEVGPRVCLQPIKIFSGSFEGQVLYENPAYVSPNKVQPPPLPG